MRNTPMMPMFHRTVRQFNRLRPGIFLRRGGPARPGFIPPLHQTIRHISEETIAKDNELGEDDSVNNTGVILKENKESLLYFDYLTPFKSGRWDLRQYFLSFVRSTSERSLQEQVLKLAQSSSSAIELNITDFKYVARDGGAFVKFLVPEDTNVKEFNKRVMEIVEKKGKEGFLGSLTHPRCFPVKGTPWIEDLRRYPSPKLKVAFEGPDLSQENLYLLFRRYGVIADIISPNPEAKETTHFATIVYRSTRSAIAARQCITGLQVGETLIHIQYIPVVKVNVVSEFVGKHQRIAIPLIFALLAAVAVFIFDPIRHFFITEKITGTYSLEKNYYYRQLSSVFASTRRRMYSMLSSSGDSQTSLYNSIEGMWKERNELAKEIKLWIDENVNTFIVVQGPKGSGKRGLIQDHVLKDRPNCLYIDCDHLIKARKEQQFLKNFAEEIGYFPVFSWLSSISSFIDLISQGLTGQKSGISESKETQVRNMLALAGTAVRDISLSKYRNLSQEVVEGTKEDDYLQQNPQDKPVIVIDRFQASKKAKDPNSFVYQELAEWAANMVTLNAAHVIVITDDIGSLQTLSRALPGTPFKRCLLSDASALSVEKYVVHQFEDDQRTSKLVEDEKKSELLEALKPFGGRMLDLQIFVRRIKSGESPKEALQGIVSQSIEQLSQLFTGGSTEGYTSSQAWCLIKLLAANDKLTYREICGLPLFKSGTFEILQAMENAELITIIREKGLVKEVKPAKPIYKLAFENMVGEERIFISLETEYLSTLIKTERAKVQGWEDEVAKYQAVEYSNLFKSRLQYLASKIDGSTRTISDSEKKLAQLWRGGK